MTCFSLVCSSCHFLGSMYLDQACNTHESFSFHWLPQIFHYLLPFCICHDLTIHFVINVSFFIFFCSIFPFAWLSTYLFDKKTCWGIFTSMCTKLVCGYFEFFNMTSFRKVSMCRWVGTFSPKPKIMKKQYPKEIILFYAIVIN